MNAEQLLDTLLDQIKSDPDIQSLDNPLLVGIHTGGIWIAEQIRKTLQIQDAISELDVSLYRDDFSEKGLKTAVKSTKIPLDTTDRHILLVDDVIHTGRTIRAAMNVLFDYGRPASIRLIVLMQRKGHDLPIRADYCAQTIDLKDGQHIKLVGPSPLQLDIKDKC